MRSFLPKYLWVLVFFLLSIIIGSGILYLRGDRPGIVIDSVQMHMETGTSRQAIPFSLTVEDDVDEPLVLDIPLEDYEKDAASALAIVRPIYFLEVWADGLLLTPPLEGEIGRDVILIPLDPDWNTISIRLRGAFGSIGIGDNILLGDSDALAKYFRMRSLTSVFLLTILLSSSVCLFLLVLFRPLQETFLSAGGFALALSLNTIANVDVWFVFSRSVEGQLRLKGFAMAMSIALAFYMLSTFTKFLPKFSRWSVGVLLLLGAGHFLLPSMEAIRDLRILLDIIVIPFIVMTMVLFVGNFHRASTELRYYYGISSVLLIGGVTDLTGVYGFHLLPPMMPIASALFMVGMTVFFVVESSNYSERYQTLVRESLDGIVIVDQYGLVVDYNPVAKFFGLSTVEPITAVLRQESIELTLLIHRAQEFEFWIKDGQVCLECHSTPLEQNRAMLVFRDVTQKKREAEKELERVRLETVEKISGGVAHDFNNLFTALQGQVSLLVEDQGSQSLRRLENIQALINNGSHALQRLQNSIHGEEPVLERILLQDWLVDLKPLCQSILREDTLICWDIPTEPIWVDMNAKQLEQIFTNIVFNANDAIHYDANQNVVWIEVKRAGPRTVEISIEDSGKGVETHRRVEVFEPFVSSKSSQRGKGLGLSIVRDSVQQMGGRIWLDDPEHGGGARFVLHLPCQAKQNDTHSSKSGSYRILVLEDEPLIRDVIETFLPRSGYQVRMASTVEEAEEILHSESIHCVISDVLLGSRVQDNGISFCNRAVAGGYLNPIVIMSGYIPEREEKAESSWYFLPKPFRQEELLGLLEDVFLENTIVQSYQNRLEDAVGK